ncbi:Serine/threonine-protein phosphatase 1 [Aquisphaera giovannonii]|uniref:Serine/threonine-protein phosphatase 1 n=1 Tax=Aquisphaera giovannonii TaxID=406548 RepID=A0A5B9VV17_9BACT|nr:metallophosphoesterase family protein [Aquisphaera giovannonii]QEH32233.1 Serine/threonine-protein phosphatase 1 [Aquisphaera giovannonii]
MKRRRADFRPRSDPAGRWITHSRPRTIAIGDIHGCSRALEALIGAIAPTPEDLVVVLGDYIDRGPDSRGVIEMLIDLGRRCRLVHLMGNHEEMLLDVRAGRLPLRWWTMMGGDATLRSYGAGSDVGRIPTDHVRFIEESVDHFETDTHVFLHANYDPYLPLQAQPSSISRWKSLSETVPLPLPWNKPVIVGHTAQRAGEILDLGHIKCIDTACCAGTWLTAMDIDTSELWQAGVEGRLRRGEG